MDKPEVEAVEETTTAESLPGWTKPTVSILQAGDAEGGDTINSDGPFTS